MGKQIVVHVGSVKTGSSYLQRWFVENRTSLLASGICYPPYRECGERFANGNLLRDVARASQVKNLVDNDEYDTIVFSEEGLFEGFLSAIPPYFWEHDVKIIGYIREPVDLVSAWAAEFCKPYNAQNGIVRDVNTNLEIVCRKYSEIMQGFLGCAEYVRTGSILLRRYEKSLYTSRYLELDFFEALGICGLVEKLGSTSLGKVNPTPTRKYCDISAELFKVLNDFDRLYEYNEHLVSTIYRNSTSGDERPVRETLGHRKAEIEAQLSWIDQELAKRFAWTPFQTQPESLPVIEVEPTYQPVCREEIEYQLLRQSVIRSVSHLSCSTTSENGIPDEELFSRIERSLANLEQRHSELLQQRAAPHVPRTSPMQNGIPQKELFTDIESSLASLERRQVELLGQRAELLKMRRVTATALLT